VFIRPPPFSASSGQRWRRSTASAEVALVVGNYDGAAFLPGCLESGRAQTRPPAEVVVVDADSRDDSQSVAESLGARVLRFENRGLAYLYNRGVEAASSAFVLLANSDVVFDAHCFALLAAALEADDRRFAADPRQLDWEGRRTIHGRTTLVRGPLLRQYLPGLRLETAAPADALVPTVSAHGAAMLVRRSQFLELGGFDETFFLDWEDLDLCWRAWLRGWPTMHVPDAVLRHHVSGVTLTAARPRREASSHHNVVRFALKCLPPAAAARVVAGELLRLPRHPRPIASGLASVARELPEILSLRRDLRPSRELFDWTVSGQPA
jgi:GT2 family glycosyltransferase